MRFEDEMMRVSDERDRLKVEVEDGIIRNKEEINEKKEDFSNLMQYFEVTRSELETSRAEIEGMVTELGASRSELEGMVTELGASRSELVRVRSEVDSGRDEINRLNQSNLTLVRKVNIFSEELAVADALKNEAEAVIEVEKDKYEQLSSVVGQFRERMKENKEKETINLEIIRESDDLMRKNEIIIVELTEMKAEKEHEILTLQEEMFSIRETQMRKDLEITTTINNMTLRNIEKDAEITQLKNEINITNCEKNVITDEIENMKNETRNQHNFLSHDIVEQIQFFTTANKKSQSEILELKTKLSNINEMNKIETERSQDLLNESIEKDRKNSIKIIELTETVEKSAAEIHRFESESLYLKSEIALKTMEKKKSITDFL